MSNNKLTLTDSSKQILKDNPEFTSKWVAGLRSDKYTQYRGGMCDPNVPNSACCLHVMEMECFDNSWESGFKGEYAGDLPSDLGKGNYGVLKVNTSFTDFQPEDLQASFDNGGEQMPSIWNDHYKLSFLQIADLLESGEVEF